MDYVPSRFPDALPIDAFGVPLPVEMNDELLKALPFQSMIVLAQVSRGWSEALRLPADIGALFAALKAAVTQADIVEAYLKIPMAPSNVRAAVMRVFFERIMQITLLQGNVFPFRNGSLYSIAIDSISETGKRLVCECEGASRDAGKRDLLMAKATLSMMFFSESVRQTMPLFEAEMCQLPKWCWPDALLAFESAARFNEYWDGLDYDHETGDLCRPYSNDAYVSILIDHLDALDPQLSDAFLVKLAVVWLKRADVDQVRDRLLRSLGLGDERDERIEWVIADRLCKELADGTASLTQAVPRWRSDVSMLYERMAQRLLLDALLHRTERTGEVRFHKESGLHSAWQASSFEWVVGGTIDQLPCFADVANVALPFWDLFWQCLSKTEDFDSLLSRILKLPSELQPTLLSRLLLRKSRSIALSAAGLEVLARMEDIADRLIDAKLYTQAIRALLLPVKMSRVQMSDVSDEYLALDWVMAFARLQIPAAYWGEVVDQVIRSRITETTAAWPAPDDRLGFLEAFFSAEDAAWKTPFKSERFVQYLLPMWERLPDRGSSDLSRVDAFSEQFTLDALSRNAFELALHQSFRDKVRAGIVSEAEYASHFAVHKTHRSADPDTRL